MTTKDVEVMGSSRPALHSADAFINGLGEGTEDVSFVDDEGNQVHHIVIERHFHTGSNFVKMVLVPSKDGYEEFAQEDDFASLEQELFSDTSTDITNFDTNNNNNVNNNVYNLFVNNDDNNAPYLETNLTYNFITPKKTPPSTNPSTKNTPTTPTTPTTLPNPTSPPVSSPPMYNNDNNSTIDQSKIYVPYWQR